MGARSMPGDETARGEMDIAEHVSEMRDGARSIESVLEISDVAGESSDDGTRRWLYSVGWIERGARGVKLLE